MFSVEVVKVLPLETCIVRSVDKSCSSLIFQQVALLDFCSKNNEKTKITS